jgi:hypothetical protein
MLPTYVLHTFSSLLFHTIFTFLFYIYCWNVENKYNSSPTTSRDHKWNATVVCIFSWFYCPFCSQSSVVHSVLSILQYSLSGHALFSYPFHCPYSNLTTSRHMHSMPAHFVYNPYIFLMLSQSFAQQPTEVSNNFYLLY